MTLISADWKLWLDDNLRRGCSEASMIDSMTKAGIDPIVGRQWLLDARAAPAGLIPAQASGTPSRAYIHDTVRLPQSGNLIRTGDREVRVALRMSRPVIALFDDLLSIQECDELVRLSSIKLKRSTIVDPQTGQQQHIEARTSDGTYFLVDETAFIASIDRRISEVLHWPSENGEGLQILRYGIGGEYRTHFDYFVPEHPGSSQHIGTGGQRVSTLIMYLNNVQEGGETIFPAIGLSVVPRKGAAVYFEYCNSQGQVDPMTLHGGTPVKAGEKWIATKWMRQRRYG